MSVKLNLGISKKIGLPDYGSAGSTCNLEIELDLSSLERPEEFHRRVREAYAACRSAVEDELRNHRANASQKPTTVPTTEYRNSTPPERNVSRFPASAKQMEFVVKLSKRIKGLSEQKLDEYCRQTFGKDSTQLSSQEASRLIDALKDAKAGKELA